MYKRRKLKKMPTKPGYRVFIDISSFKQVGRGGNKHWLIIVDEFSDYAHSFFLKKKSDQIKILPMWIKEIAKKHRIEIKRIRLDNSGENKSLQKECDKQNLGIIFEFTAPATPQQNSVAERRIPTLMGRARAMLNQVGLEAKYKEEFWCEVISTATKLDNIMVRPERTKPPHTLFYGEDAKYARSLRTFGEMAVVSIHEGKKMRSKLDNRGKTCMFVGYADNHTKDVYRFLNIHTKRIILSRDVRWLNVMWKQYKKKSIYARSRVELFLDTVFIDISSFEQVSRGGNKHWLIIVDEFSDYAHSFFLKKKSDQIKILPIWIKGIARKHRILKLRGSGLTTVEKTKACKKNVTNRTLELFLSSLHLRPLNKTQ